MPLLLGGYLWQLRRKRKNAVRYSSVALIRQAIPKRSRWHRHVPPALFLAAIAALMFGAARPQISEDISINKTSIILTLDVSGSMCATDVAPNRLTAAQNAAKEFVENQVAGTRIGIIAFSNFAQLVVPPTTRQGGADARHRRADDESRNGDRRGDAAGHRCHRLDRSERRAGRRRRRRPGQPGWSRRRRQRAHHPTPLLHRCRREGYVPDIVVLLTDGANTRGISPVDAAKQAADRRVRVYTIGFGTDNPTAMVCSAAQLGAGGFDGGPGGGPRQRWIRWRRRATQLPASATRPR